MSNGRPQPQDADKKAYDFFISYAREDEHSVARPLADEFSGRGFSVWLDKLVLDDRSGVEDAILSGLDNCYCPVTVVSEHFLRKEWPKKELEILLAIEEVEERNRIIIVRHGISEAHYKAIAPELAARTEIETDLSIPDICDRIEQLATAYADRGRVPSSGERPVAPIPKFFAPGAVSCPNHCSWTPPPDMAVISNSIGPQFTLKKSDGYWYVICDMCKTVALGPITPAAAKRLMTRVRMYLYTPEVRPYLKGRMS